MAREIRVTCLSSNDGLCFCASPGYHFLGTAAGLLPPIDGESEKFGTLN